MNTIDREELKEQLRAMAAGRGEGIELDTPFHWVIEDLKEPTRFFEHLPELLPPGSILYVEGTAIVPELAAFYSSHRALVPVEVVRDTIAPVPDIYHFTFTPAVCAGLRRFAEGHPVGEMFDHLKAYRDGTLLFTFHDAFAGRLCIAEQLPAEVVASFCEALGVSRRREATRRRDPELLRRLLQAIEHPGRVKFRVAGESWWRRWWRLWTGS